MPEQETTINELMDFLQENMVTMDYLQENMVTMDYLQENMFTKSDGEMLEKRIDEKINHIHLELSGQIRMIEIELKDIKERLIRLENRTIEDADAAAHDILELRKRVEALERQVQELQPA